MLYGSLTCMCSDPDLLVVKEVALDDEVLRGGVGMMWRPLIESMGTLGAACVGGV